MRRTLLAGAAVLAMSFGVIACGSSDDSSGDSSASSDEALTKAELITEADALCAKFDTEVAAGISELDEQSGQAEFEAYISDTLVPLYRDQIDQLRELTPSESEEEEYTALVDTLETELDAVEENPESALSDTTPFPDSTAAAKDLGLKVCGA